MDDNGFFTTQYQGRAIINSAIDSGTNGYAFSDTTIPTTGEWYTPTSERSLSATMEATNGSGHRSPCRSRSAMRPTRWRAASRPMTTSACTSPACLFYDVSTDTMLSEEGFLWGLPFFYGRSVYTVLENAKVGTQAGPFVAF